MLIKAKHLIFAAAVTVARKEMWRRRAIWERVQDFRDLTGIPITSHIISLVMNSQEKALEASQYIFYIYLRLFMFVHYNKIN